ncbi:homeobox KN domain-containing protein, partial [Mycotypha africana]|uniref:homeobox KN domain-containing protein n=1 Tax=Mycotypha africana TaxID=64632 RepID=UPI00230038FF
RPILNKKRRRGNLPKEVTELLKRWLILHKSYPYPTEREKQQLADQTGLMVSQISNWFINARRRILQPLL